MRESRLYLNFLIENRWVFIASIFFGVIVTYLLYTKLIPQTSYRLVANLKMETSPDLNQAMLLTDQLTAELRAKFVTGNFSSNRLSSKLLIYKSAPLLIRVEYTSTNDNTASGDYLQAIISFSQHNYPIKLLNLIDYSTVEANKFYPLGIGLVVGLFLGIIISLIRHYLRYF